MAGIKLTHVAYKGNSPALNDLLGGHVEVMFVSPSFGRPYLPAGRLRALGIAGPRRLPSHPTCRRSTKRDSPATTTRAITACGSRPVSAEIVRRLHGEIVKALAAPGVRKYLAEADTSRSATRRRNSPRS